MCICVVLISMSEGHAPEATENSSLDAIEEESNTEKILAVVFAICTGVIFSTNSIEMHYSAKTQNIGAT